jgi:predicted metal-dependent hydrolase
MDRTTVRMLMDSLNRDAARIARHFGLSYESIEPERANVKSRYGICYSDGVIKIRLRHATTGRPLKYSSLVATLCHELAHLRHFDHGLRFRAFNQEVLAFARAQGIYRPRSEPTARAAPRPPAVAPSRSRPPRPPGPAQLELF